MILRVTCAGFVGPHEQEDNDSFGRANGPLCYSRDYSGDVNDVYDLFYVNWDGSGALSINLQNFVANEWLQLYYEGDTSNDVASHNSPSTNFHIDYAGPKPAGRYYIVLFADQGHGTAGPSP